MVRKPKPWLKHKGTVKHEGVPPSMFFCSLHRSLELLGRILHERNCSVASQSSSRPLTEINLPLTPPVASFISLDFQSHCRSCLQRTFLTKTADLSASIVVFLTLSETLPYLVCDCPEFQVWWFECSYTWSWFHTETSHILLEAAGYYYWLLPVFFFVFFGSWRFVSDEIIQWGKRFTQKSNLDFSSCQ